MAGIEPRPGIMDIALYVGGKSRVEGVSNVIKLSSNENPFGPSPAAQEAVRRVVHEMHRYPSTDHAELRQAIAEVHGLEAERIILGVGSDEVLQFPLHPAWTHVASAAPRPSWPDPARRTFWQKIPSLTPRVVFDECFHPVAAGL